jgi:chaperonin GroES
MIKALGNKIFIKPDEVDEVSKGGIVLGSAAEKSKSGVVLSVGKGSYHEVTGELVPNCVEEGDKVMFVPQATEEVEVDDETIIVTTDEGIIGVIK